LYVVIESKDSVVLIRASIAFQSTVDSLKGGSEGTGFGVNIKLPETCSCCPTYGRISGNLIRILDKSVVVVQVCRACFIIVIPGELQHTTAVVNFIGSTSLVAWISILACLHIVDAELFRCELESDGFPTGVGQIFGSFLLIGDTGSSQGIDESCVVRWSWISTLGLGGTLELSLGDES